MHDVRSLRCPTCGAQLPAVSTSSAWVVCDYCKAPLAIGQAAPQAPRAAAPGGAPVDMGAILQGPCVVVLEHTGPNKIAVIKEIRTVAGCGLKEAKDFSEQLPSRFPLNNPRVQARDVVGLFAAAGARVRLERA